MLNFRTLLIPFRTNFGHTTFVNFRLQNSSSSRLEMPLCFHNKKKQKFSVSSYKKNDRILIRFLALSSILTLIKCHGVAEEESTRILQSFVLYCTYLGCLKISDDSIFKHFFVRNKSRPKFIASNNTTMI